MTGAIRRSAAGAAAARLRQAAATRFARLRATPFGVLTEEFISQFFASESATSDHQLRTAIIGVLVFLFTPGFLMPVRLSATLENVAIRHPELLPRVIQLIATIFLSYGMVTIGVVAAFTWDGLGFDRRDAMVLGTLPVRGRTIIAAKLAALAALLMTCAAIVNLMSGVPFSLAASNHGTVVGLLRHFAAHMVATMSAAVFVFSVLVTLRALVGMIGTGRVAIASLIQFTLVVALLCFFIVVPASMDIKPSRIRANDRIYLLPIPGWSPTNWFLGLYEVIRGAGVEGAARAAAKGAAFTTAAIAAAIASTIASYRRQMRFALTPSAAPSARLVGRLLSAFARAIAGPNRVARATADFVVSTLLRNRPPQVPIALNAALGMTIAILALVQRRGVLTIPRTIVLWIPLLACFWTAVGLRVSLFTPSEIRSGWIFQANGPPVSRGYWLGTRAALTALLAPATAAIAWIVTAPLLGWRIAAWHGAFAALMAVVLAEFVALTITHIPFTQPYPPGHAKLKARWPLYLFGMFAFASFPVRAEMRALAAGWEPTLLLYAAGAAAALHALGWWCARRWSVEPRDEFADDPYYIPVLDIGDVVHGAHRRLIRPRSTRSITPGRY